MMSGVDEFEAKQAAIKLLSGMLHTPDQLARVALYLDEYAVKKRDAEARLHEAIRTQTDELQLSRQLLQHSAKAIEDVRKDFSSIDEYCWSGKALLLRDQKLIEDVNKVRNNLASTHRLMKNLRSIPEQAEQLEHELENDETRIKHVYKELRRLVILRDSASGQGAKLKELKTQLEGSFEKLNKCADFVEMILWENIAEAYVLATGSAEEKATLIRTLEVICLEDKARRIKVFDYAQHDQFKALPGPGGAGAAPGHRLVQVDGIGPMMKKCQNCLRKNLLEKFSSLLQTEEMVRQNKAEDWAQRQAEKKLLRHQERKAASKAAKAANNDSAGTIAGSEGDEGEDDDEGDEGDDIDDTSTDDDSEEEIDTKDFVSKLVLELHDLMTQLHDECNTLGPMFPLMGYTNGTPLTLRKFLQSEYRAWFLKVITLHTSEPDKLNKSEQLKLVKLIQWYKKELSTMKGQPTEQESFTNIVEALMRAFVESTQKNLHTMIENTLKQEEQAVPYEEATGFMFTNGPTDLFTTVNQSLDITLKSYGLQGKAVEHIAEMLVDVFTHVQNHQINCYKDCELDAEQDRLVFGPNRLALDHVYFCAQINNAQRCQENMEDVGEELLDAMRRETDNVTTAAEKKDQQQALTHLEDVWEECALGFVEVARQASTVLVVMIMTNIEGLLRDSFFSVEWLRSGGEHIEELLKLLRDMLEDYSSMIARDAYFAKVIRTSLQELVGEYCNAFAAKNLKVDDVSSTVARLAKDREALHDFFSDFNELLEENTYHVIEGEFKKLSLVEAVMGVHDTDFMEAHFVPMLEHFGEASQTVFAGIMACRNDPKPIHKEIMEAFIESLPPQYQHKERRTANQDDPQFQEAGRTEPTGIHLAAPSVKRLWTRFKEKASHAAERVSPAVARRQKRGPTGAATQPDTTTRSPPPIAEEAEVFTINDFLS